MTHELDPISSGYVLVDKPSGPSSHAAVQQVRRALGIGGRRGTKAGHAGTLDPFASGLLLVLVGQATRLMGLVVGHDKRYLVEVRFGASSSTDDREGELVQVAAGVVRPTREQVAVALPALAAATEQVPPAVSAIHVDGQRAYQRVRRGEVVDVPARPVRFDRVELVDWREPVGAEEGPTATLDVRCAAGTYMRALARDLGEAVGCSAYCTELRRNEVGELVLAADAPAPEQVTRAHVRDARELLDLPELQLDEAGLADIAAGRRVDLPAQLAGAEQVALVAPGGELAALARPTSDAKLLQPTAVFVQQP